MSSPVVRLVCRQLSHYKCSNIRYASIPSSCNQLNQARNLYLCASHQQNLNEGSIKNSDIETESKADIDEERDKPVRYTSSKAKNWTVGHSFGKHKAKERSVKKVVAVCTVFLGLLAWVFLRKETEIDKILGNDLNEVLKEQYPSYKPPETK